MARMAIEFPFEREGMVSHDLALQGKCYNNMNAEALGEGISEWRRQDFKTTADYLEKSGDVCAAWHLRDELKRFE